MVSKQWFEFVRRANSRTPFNQGRKKTPKHKDFTKNPMPESTFFRSLQAPKFFVFGLCFLSLKCRKMQTQRVLKGGRKNFVLDSFGCFFSLFFNLNVTSVSLVVRNALSTAGNSMTSALRGPLRNQFWKKRRRRPYWGGEISGNALKASNALNYRVWGIPAVLSRGERFLCLSGFFPEFLPESPSRTGGMAPVGACLATGERISATGSDTV